MCLFSIMFLITYKINQIINMFFSIPIAYYSRNFFYKLLKRCLSLLSFFFRSSAILLVSIHIIPFFLGQCRLYSFVPCASQSSPLFISPAASIPTLFFSRLPAPILIRCPYQSQLFFLNFTLNTTHLNFLRVSSFLISSILVTSSIFLKNLISQA